VKKVIYNQLTAWSIVLLKKLIITQQVKKFPAFSGSRRLFTSCTRAHHWPLRWATSLFHTLRIFLFKIHSNIILPSTPRSYE